MELEDFKRIYWMEHAHRVYGRLLGLAIIVPSAVFALRGWVSPKWRRTLFGICGLVGFQGLLGWHMVRSGLSTDIVEKQQAARVSQYRLAAHLTSAFVLYLTLLRSGLKILYPPNPSIAAIPRMRQLKFLATGLTHLLVTTAVAGAFVAGLDAGMIYNTFPNMGASFVPSDIWDARLGWKNPFENPTTAQFVHRCLAYGSVGWATTFWIYSRKMLLPPHLRLASNVIMAAVWAQGSLGLLTLLYCVPVSLASAHQAGSLVVLTACTYMLNFVKNK